MTPQERLVATATDQVGYIGKKTNSQLDSFTANGGGKYNKFARDLDALKDFYNGPKNGYDWCDVFVDWCFVQTFGREIGQKMIFQPNRSAGAGTGYSMGYYKSNGQLFTTPQVGDQIFFGDAKSTWHTGIVSHVTGATVSTIEGNSGKPLGVHAFQYSRGSKIIKGYGRPNWGLVGAAPAQEPKPVSRTYTVQRGDSLWGIAAKLLRNGTRYVEIRAVNGLKDNTIHPGQVLKIPQ